VAAELLPVFVAAELLPVFVAADQSPVFVAADQLPVFVAADLSPVFVAADLLPVFVAAELLPVFVAAELLPVFVAELSAHFTLSNMNLTPAFINPFNPISVSICICDEAVLSPFSCISPLCVTVQYLCKFPLLSTGE